MTVEIEIVEANGNVLRSTARQIIFGNGEYEPKWIASVSMAGPEANHLNIGDIVTVKAITGTRTGKVCRIEPRVDSDMGECVAYGSSMGKIQHLTHFALKAL